MSLQKVIISAPFGNYLQFPDTTPTHGSFTVTKRAGLPLRLWKILSTVRYYPRLQCWSNKLGLPNPGIATFLKTDTSREESIVSIYGFSGPEWESLLWATQDFHYVELNLSCPNVAHEQTIESIRPHLRKMTYPERYIAKLPPFDWFKLAAPLYFDGITTFHLCNTIPSPGGGISGKALKTYSLWAIHEFRQKWGRTVKLIGGGGITCLDDVYEYQEAGADYIAVGSMLFNPRNHRKISEFVEAMNGSST